jgi:hypothetical protein
VPVLGRTRDAESPGRVCGVEVEPPGTSVEPVGEVPDNHVADGPITGNQNRST